MTTQATFTTLTVPTEDAMFELLTGLNVSGHHPELPCVTVVDVGGPGAPNLAVSPFLATLTDPDADRVNYIASDGSGRSQCVMNCDNCGSANHPTDGSPRYPITALVAVWPDEDRCHDDGIDIWWTTPHPTAATEALQHLNCMEWDTTTRTECGLPAVAVPWGTLFSKEQVGPKCRDHFNQHHPAAMSPARSAILDVTNIRAALTTTTGETP